MRRPWTALFIMCAKRKKNPLMASHRRLFASDIWFPMHGPWHVSVRKLNTWRGGQGSIDDSLMWLNNDMILTGTNDSDLSSRQQFLGPVGLNHLFSVESMTCRLGSSQMPLLGSRPVSRL